MTPSAALLLVDVQYDFLPPDGSLAVPEGDQIIPTACELLKGKWDFVAATQDHHPPGHISFASTHGGEVLTYIDVPYPYAKEGESSTISQMLWPDHCIQGTRGAKIEESVQAALQPWIDSEKGVIIQKGTDISVDAYSAFGSTPGVPPHSSVLVKDFRARGIGTVFVVGLAYDFCVRFSAMDAKRVGFDTCIIREGVRAVGSAEETKKVTAEYSEAGIHIVGMSDPSVQAWL